MAGTRADHYVKAEEKIWRARREMGKAETTPFEHLTLELLVGIGHALLAAAGPGVEQEVKDNERAVARALGATENDQRARQAARPPLAAAVAMADEYRRLQADADRAERERLEAERADWAARPEVAKLLEATTCRCTGLPHDLGSPGCSVPGMNRLMGVEETAGTVRPKIPREVIEGYEARPKPGPTGCRCGRPVGAHQRGAVGCAHEVQS
jgi:hypothetical protein